MESCHPAVARHVKLWSLNANLFFEEPRQLTVHLNHIWQRTFPFEALIAIFRDLQPLWPSSLTNPDLLGFRCSFGPVLSKTKSVTPHFFFYISDITNSSSFKGKIFRKKSMLEIFCANVLKKNMWKEVRILEFIIFHQNALQLTRVHCAVFTRLHCAANSTRTSISPSFRVNSSEKGLICCDLFLFIQT